MKKLKIILSLFVAVCLVLALTETVLAASLSVRMSEPKTPTNRKDFEVSFVALDIEGRDVTVTCYKKGPADGSFFPFGSVINLQSGGNSGSCNVDSSIVASDGIYSFYVEAAAGSSSEISNTVVVEVSTVSPWTPVSYSKEKINSCEYRIKFKTADDGGLTKKVEIYRSTETSFNLDDGSRVNTISVGSNEEKEYVESVPFCNKDYYYAIRAFDDYGNGSGSIGDSVVKTTVVNKTIETVGGVPGATAQEEEGAVVVREGESFVSSPSPEVVEGLDIEERKEASQEMVLGAETGQFSKKYIIIGLAVLAIFGITIYVIFLKKREK